MNRWQEWVVESIRNNYQRDGGGCRVLRAISVLSANSRNKPASGLGNKVSIIGDPIY